MRRASRWSWRLPPLVLVVAASFLATGAGKAQAHACVETVNPAGTPAVGNNGQNIPPYGNDAVPGGRSTSPGTNGNGPLNSDGFYAVWGALYSDDTPIPNPEHTSNFWGSTGVFVFIKYTETGNSGGGITVKKIGGPNSAIAWHISAPGDLYLEAPKNQGGVGCLVPPPPF